MGTIRFGLCAVRGVGEKAVEGVMLERKERGQFRSLYDFTERVDLRAVQRSTIEALIKCGALGSTGGEAQPVVASAGWCGGDGAAIAER